MYACAAQPVHILRLLLNSVTVQSTTPMAQVLKLKYTVLIHT